MILLTVDEIIALHNKILFATGGESGLRDRALLESAIYSVIQSFGEEELYKTVEEKAARLTFAITKNHPFIDGNKRIGVFVMLMTLKLNAINILYSQQELIQLGLNIANSDIEFEGILKWIIEHKTT